MNGFAAIPEARRFVLANATVPAALVDTGTTDSAADGLITTDITIADGKVETIGASRGASGLPRLDLDFGMVWPCFVDMHTHIDKGHIAPRKANPDGSLSFYCAIDEGLVLTLSEGHDLLTRMEDLFADLRAEIGRPEVVIGFECILNRLEAERGQIKHQLSRLLAANNVTGFASFGEQWGSMHVNQTFTGIAIGSAWMLTVTAEMVAVKSGLGYVLWDSYYFLRYDIVLAAMISIGLLGYLSDLGLKALMASVLHWQKGTTVQGR